MWKTLPRGFREIFERGLSLGRNNTNSGGRVQSEGQRTRYCQNYYARSSCFLTSYRDRQKCEEGTRDQEEGTRGEQRSYQTYTSDSWLGTVSYSSALALAWVLSQPCNWKRWLRDNSPSNCWQSNKCKSLVGVLAKVAVAQPPLAPVPPIGAQQEETEDGVPYGPITAQEAFNEAANTFFKAHNSIHCGELENKKAVALVEGPIKDPRRAIQLFFSASKKGYLPAAYNLGQCYELGIGTKQDFNEAAKWYRKAADGGHPKATYNLAVFHAHGWGGLAADNRRAKQLLESAAALGVADAAAALGITKEDVPPPSPLSNVAQDELIANESRVSSLQDISRDPNELYKLASTFENSPCEDVSQPYLVLQLYKMASDLGHKEAKSKYQILHSYDTVGLLTEYLCRGSKPTSDCSNLKFSSLF